MPVHPPIPNTPVNVPRASRVEFGVTPRQPALAARPIVAH
jgi:hypothetical protein